MRNTVAFLLAGGMGSRLNVLGWMRAKPAVPFGGCYRLIDFSMSNAMYSDIQQIAILTQYRPHSLMSHIGTGEPWDLIGRSRCAKIRPPSTGIDDYDWYRGTADAVAQNLDFANHYDAARILVLSGDHIYRMNYAPMVEFHKDYKADITIAVMKVPWEETRHFGIAITDSANRIIDWEEKPEKARNNLASMGVYVIDYDFIVKSFEKRSGHDFGKNIVRDAINESNVFAYPFDGYWEDVGTIKAYWQSNMDILNPDSGLCLHEWAIRTNYEEEGLKGDRPPAKYGQHAEVINSLISPGCFIDGKVVNSVLSPGVRVLAGSEVKDSVIMHDSVIEKNCLLDTTIADKNTRFGEGARVGIGESEKPNEKYPDHLYSGITLVGKQTIIPARSEIYTNTIIEPLVSLECFQSNRVQCGGYVKSR